MQISAESPQTLEPRPAHKTDKVGIALAAVGLAVLLGVWLWVTPPGLWGKLQALGYAVCHQVPEHSFSVAGRQFPLCARCTGMYLGSFFTLAFLFKRGRRGKFPPAGMLIALALFFLTFALDGVNSLLESLPGLSGLYEPQNWLRLLTGLAAGLCIGAVLAPIFNQTAWEDWQALPSLNTLLQLAGLLVLLGAVFGGVLSGIPWLGLLLAALSALAVWLLLTLIYTTLALILLGRQNRARHLGHLALPLLVGALLALLQILVTSGLRFALTRTWAPFNL